MNTFEVRDKILEKLNAKRSDYGYRFDREKETLRVYRSDNQKGLTVSISQLKDKYQDKELMIDEIVYYIDETLNRMGEEVFDMNTSKIMPIVRSTSFFKESKSGEKFIFDSHTNETNIYYAIDLEKSYRIIDESLLTKLNISHEDLKVVAFQNLRLLPVEITNQDTISENVFYFINYNDGYDASRILNTEFLESFSDRIEGEMLVGLPHQDVLIIVDVRNDIGYDVMAQMMMKYFAEGLTPITSLTFSYDSQVLTPIFILGKEKRNRKGENE